MKRRLKEPIRHSEHDLLDMRSNLISRHTDKRSHFIDPRLRILSEHLQSLNIRFGKITESSLDEVVSKLFLRGLTKFTMVEEHSRKTLELEIESACYNEIDAYTKERLI